MDNDKIKKGDMIWVELKGAEQNYGYGEVTSLWKDKKTDLEFFDFYCLINGGLRIGRIDKIIHKPTTRMTNKFAQTQAEIREVLRNKK
jgi:hypothetical protein